MRVLTLLLLGASLAASDSVTAAELGKLIVRSGQSQPLKAEIEIDAAPGDAAAVPTAALAPAETYRGTGLTYNPILRDVHLAVDRLADGRYVIQVTSQAPLDLPYLEMIVQLNAPSGQTSRVYTLLLEPTGPGGVFPPPPMVEREVPKREVPLREVPKSPPVASTPAATSAAPVAMAEPSTSAPASSAPAGTYVVKPGDTLSEIARANLPDGVSLVQMLVALYRANEGAFLEKNMNLVREGSELTLPNAQSAAAVSHEGANTVVSVQTAEYNAYRHRAGPSPAVAATRGAGQDRLLVARDDSAARADDLAALEREAKESKARVARLEKHLNDLQALLELKTELLARLEAQARAVQAARGVGKAAASKSPAGRLRGTPAEIEFKKTHPCPAPGERDETCSGYVVTHVVPLCAGGANEPANMQWQRLEEAIRNERSTQERCRRG